MKISVRKNEIILAVIAFCDSSTPYASLKASLRALTPRLVAHNATSALTEIKPPLLRSKKEIIIGFSVLYIVAGTADSKYIKTVAALIFSRGNVFPTKIIDGKIANKE